MQCNTDKSDISQHNVNLAKFNHHKSTKKTVIPLLQECNRIYADKVNFQYKPDTTGTRAFHYLKFEILVEELVQA